jgi:hypothetical protein
MQEGNRDQWGREAYDDAVAIVAHADVDEALGKAFHFRSVEGTTDGLAEELERLDMARKR